MSADYIVAAPGVLLWVRGLTLSLNADGNDRGWSQVQRSGSFEFDGLKIRLIKFDALHVTLLT